MVQASDQVEDDVQGRLGVMKLYQVFSMGPSLLFDFSVKIYSKKIFRTREEAMEYRPMFEKICTTEKGEFDIQVISRVDVFRVMELELEE